MTNTTLREEFAKQFWFVFTINDGCDKPISNDILDFIESKAKEWEANMKQRVQYLIDWNDDYIHFIEQFKQL